MYLPRLLGSASVRTEKRPGGMVIDFAADGRAIGIELLSPETASLQQINEVLAQLHESPATQEEVAPLAA